MTGRCPRCFQHHVVKGCISPRVVDVHGMDILEAIWGVCSRRLSSEVGARYERLHDITIQDECVRLKQTAIKLINQTVR
jgi:hypothetical protein